MMGSICVTLGPSGARPQIPPTARNRVARCCAPQQQAIWVRSATDFMASPEKAMPDSGRRRHVDARGVAPLKAAWTPDPADDPKQMVWTLARLPLTQRACTLAVALGKLASEAGTTYTTIIGAKLLVSRQLRFQDAFLTIGLTMGGNLLQLLEAQWEIELERRFQATMVPWLAKRQAQNVPHDVATFDALGKLTLERSTQWVAAAGLVGRLGSSFYAALGNSHQVPRALLAAMVGMAVVRHALATWWTQHIQQRVTDWTLERGRSTFALLRGAGLGLSSDLQRASIGVESVQEAILLATYYGMFWHLGWFAPHASLETLVTVQAGMAAMRALVASILMVPLFVIEQLQMHTRVQTYLRAEAH
jgi:hypothetical protein